MGRGEKTQELDIGLLPWGAGGKSPTIDAPQRATTASSSGRMGHYHPPPVAYYCQPFSSTDKLFWQRHTPPYSGEATIHDWADGNFFEPTTLHEMT